jgi:hypothetical protein
MNPEKAESLSPGLQAALEPLLHAIESPSERIAEYNEHIENLVQQRYPQVAPVGWWNADIKPTARMKLPMPRVLATRRLFTTQILSQIRFAMSSWCIPT